MPAVADIHILCRGVIGVLFGAGRKVNVLKNGKGLSIYDMHHPVVVITVCYEEPVQILAEQDSMRFSNSSDRAEFLSRLELVDVNKILGLQGCEQPSTFRIDPKVIEVRSYMR